MIDEEDKTTTNHDVIKNWVEERDAKPAIVIGTKTHTNRKGLLRISFPGYAEENVREISWEKFFQIFDERDLVFQFQETKRNGEPSYFCKITNKNDSSIAYSNLEF